MSDEKYYITIGSRKYAFNIDTLKKICFVSNEQMTKEREITMGYTIDDDADVDSTNTLQMTSKMDRELKTNGNSQSDAIVWDFIKLIITRLLNNVTEAENFNNNNNAIDFSTALCVNTLIKAGIMEEVVD